MEEAVKHLLDFCHVEQLLAFQWCEIRLLTTYFFICLTSFWSLFVCKYCTFYEGFSNSMFSERAQIHCTGNYVLSVSQGLISAGYSLYLSLPILLFFFWVSGTAGSRSNSRKCITEVQTTWDQDLVALQVQH